MQFFKNSAPDNHLETLEKFDQSGGTANFALGHEDSSNTDSVGRANCQRHRWTHVSGNGTALAQKASPRESDSSGAQKHRSRKRMVQKRLSRLGTRLSARFA